jgi:hypothetical protein
MTRDNLIGTGVCAGLVAMAAAGMPLPLWVPAATAGLMIRNRLLLPVVLLTIGGVAAATRFAAVPMSDERQLVMLAALVGGAFAIGYLAAAVVWSGRALRRWIGTPDGPR